MGTLSHLREQVYLANLDLVAKQLVIETWGNVSGIDRESGMVVIKPSGVDYAALTPDTMVITDLAGRVREGCLRPSSDLLTHLEIYRSFASVGGVAHTHSTAATAFAQARRSIPCLGTTHADHFNGSVPVTRDMAPRETASNYELNTGRLIAETVGDAEPLDVPAVLVASHGPFTWGLCAADAVTNSVVLEAVARMALGTLLLADTHPIAGHLLDRHFHRKHGSGAYYGQEGKAGTEGRE